MIGWRKAATAVHVGVTIGVASSLVFAIIGVGSMVGRKNDVGWSHRVVVILMFSVVVLGSGALLAAMGHH